MLIGTGLFNSYVLYRAVQGRHLFGQAKGYTADTVPRLGREKDHVYCQESTRSYHDSVYDLPSCYLGPGPGMTAMAGKRRSGSNPPPSRLSSYSQSQAVIEGNVMMEFDRTNSTRIPAGFDKAAAGTSGGKAAVVKFAVRCCQALLGRRGFSETGIDSHKWESKMQILSSLSSRRR